MKQIFTIIIIFISINSLAQHLPKFSNYEMNKNILNPAAIFDKKTTINLFYKNQWLGFENSPATAGFNIALKYENSGFGAFYLNDKAGVFNQNIFHLNYSYALQVSSETFLNFGLSGGFNVYGISYQNLELHDPNDPYISSTKQSSFLPDLNFGLIFSNIQNTSDFSFSSLAKKYPVYYVGGSVQHLLGVLTDDNIVKNNTYMNRHFNFLGAIMHPVGAFFQLQELLLIKYTFNVPVQAEFGAKFFYRGKYWIGLSYRTSNDIITKIGMKYKFINFGYAFDFSVFKIPNKTSHGIVLGFTIPFNDKISKY